MSSLLRKTAGGAGWTIGWRAATRALGFLNTLALARLLVPSDFRLVALAMSFSRAIDILADLGVQDALIRIGAPSRATYDTAFTVNAIRGLITATMIGVLAWPFAQFLDDPRLFLVVLALAGAVTLDSFVNVGVADFRREFAFHREFQLYMFPRLAQVVVTMGAGLELGQLLGAGLRHSDGTGDLGGRKLCDASLPAASLTRRLARYRQLLDMDMARRHRAHGARARHRDDRRRPARPGAGGHLRDRR
jgi:hypothetical protein